MVFVYVYIKFIIIHREGMRDPAGTMFHFWCPVPVQVRTDEQTYRETGGGDRANVSFLVPFPVQDRTINRQKTYREKREMLQNGFHVCIHKVVHLSKRQNPLKETLTYVRFA